MSDLPVNGELLSLAQRFRSDQELADHLGVPRTTVRDHIDRQPGLRAFLRAQRAGRETQTEPSEIQVITRDYRNEEKHTVYPLGDVHIGAASHDQRKWEGWIGYLVDTPHSSLLGTGDFLNTAILGSKSDVYEEKMTVRDAKRLLIDQLRPLADHGRIDALLPGNHENRITRATGDCPINDVADALGVNYARASALIVYLVGDQTYEVYLRHGTGSGQSLVQLAKSAQIIHADIYVTGHIHRQAVTVDDYFVVDQKKKITRREKRYFVSSGAFLRYETYAAERGYPPSRLGAPRIFLDGRRHDVHVSV